MCQAKPIPRPTNKTPRTDPIIPPNNFKGLTETLIVAELSE
jgi:hypothetical protein